MSSFASSVERSRAAAILVGSFVIACILASWLDVGGFSMESGGGSEGLGRSRVNGGRARAAVEDDSVLTASLCNFRQACRAGDRHLFQYVS
jgi:hypothetical protein